MQEQRLTRQAASQPIRIAAGAGHRLFLPAPVPRLRLVGLFFELDKCFLLPQAMEGIRELKARYDAQPPANVLVVGHTDTSGEDDYNLTLSLERADATAAYLKDDVAAWEAFFERSKPEKKRWGLREVQYMLSALPEGKPPFYEGDVNGLDDERHRAAVTAFQRSRELEDDGIAGPITREALITAYMALDGTTLPETATLVTHGCGESFPAEETGDGKQEADNRRVEIFFFEGAIDPPPGGRTSARGATDYPAWLERVSQTVDIVLGGASSNVRLASRYALERFEKLAAMIEESEFCAWASFSYGADIPLDAYKALRSDLVARSLEAPEIQVVPGGIDGEDAAYDDSAQMIGVKEEIAVAAETDEQAKGQLYVMLLHEFGHHVDYLLRNVYSDVGGDSESEEGHRFAYGITALHHVDVDAVPFATLTVEGVETELVLDIKAIHESTKKYLADPEAQDDAKRRTVEYFGAGRGNNDLFPETSFGHRSVEDGLRDADAQFYNQLMRDQIYFGNWLRDFSQANDPVWLQFFKNRFFDAVAPAIDYMAELLDVKAHAEFEPTLSPSQHRQSYFRVTGQKLGVYRPEEHIDNPEGIKDGSMLDPRFRGAHTPAEIAINPNTGLKQYIATRGLGFRTAAEFVEDSLRAAGAQFNREATRLFGQALHALEDLYSHSNFIELTLIRLGHTQVFPWVGPASVIFVTRGTKVDRRLPMVTGMFGSADMTVSVGSAYGESLQKPIQCDSQTFAPASIALIKLIAAVTPDGGKAIESFFRWKHELEEKYPDVAKYYCETTDSVRLWMRTKMGTAVRERVAEEARAAAAFFRDPRSTSPTHSQVAKDHDDHPLHAIAAKLAKEVVREMGLAMRDVWFKQKSVDALVAQALAYLVHPNDIDLTTDNPQKRLVDKIKHWADTNAGALIELDLPHMKKRYDEHQHASKERADATEEMYADNASHSQRTQELLLGEGGGEGLTALA